MWERFCPECTNVIFHTELRKRNKVHNEKRLCKSCAKRGKRNSQYGKTGNKSPNFGKRFSNEHRNKLSQSHTGKVF